MKIKNFIIFSLIFFLISSCEKKEHGVVKIGAILPLTGNVAVFGKWMQQGYELGLSEYERNNTNFNHINLLFEDSKNDAKDGISALNKLININRVDIIISAMSKVSIPLIPITEGKNLPHFMQDVTYPNVTNLGKHLFRHFIQSDREAKILSDYITNTLRLKTAAIIYVNDEAGVGAKNQFEKSYSAKGKILQVQAYESSASDFKTLVTRVINLMPECIFLFGNGPSWANCLKTLHQQNYRGTILTNTAMYITTFRNMAGENSLNGVIFTFPVIDSTSVSGRKFIELYENKYKQFPPLEAAYAYDIISFICKAVKTQNSESLLESLEKNNRYSGAFGETKIINNDFITKVAIAQWNNNGYKIISIY